MSDQKVLVIGGGGREHAITWKLSESPKVSKIFVSPGNCGIASVPKVSLVPLSIKDNKEVATWCVANAIDLVVVGPEDHLANGLADELKSQKIPCFGPQKSGARLESDKDWSKVFMDRHGIPTARWRSFQSPPDAKRFIRDSDFPALVVKASGLAAGKGVVVAKDRKEACEAVEDILEDKRFGAAGETVVVEELLEGEEVSVLVFTDGKSFRIMPATQDHKRIFDNDEGPNTGGMGAYGPCLLIGEEEMKEVEERVVKRTVEGLRSDGIDYVGVLYAGLMLTRQGPKVLEFNCRFGDPETQILMTLLNTDLFEIMKSCCEGRLSSLDIDWHKGRFSAGVILASRGYPASSSKGQVISHVEEVLREPATHIFHSGTSESSTGELLTNGGRVLMTVALAPTLELAAAKATVAARTISFEGKQFRTDIAHKGIARTILKVGKMSYKASGVDIQAGDDLVSRIKPLVASTNRSGVLGAIGGFGGLFDTKAAGFQDPILVSGTDGVGTKLKIAMEINKHDTVGIDLVAMCVNDVLAHGAEPLFFLDYFACGHLDVSQATSVITGIVEGCRQAGCALVGGETAEMPDFYPPGEYDLAGFAVGAVERSQLLPRTSEILPGDVVIGLPSSGVHSNGFSLVRKILRLAGKGFEDPAPFGPSGRTIGEELLVPTRIYARSIVPALKMGAVKAFAHITGGGLTENIPRILPEGVGVVIDADKWRILPVFGWLAATGGISEGEMLRTFNCGVGGVIVCGAEDQERVLEVLQGQGAAVIGAVRGLGAEGGERVVVENFGRSLAREMRGHVPAVVRRLEERGKRVGVLISGSGTNLQALIDATEDPLQQVGAKIVVVVANKGGVEGLRRAERAGIPTKVIKHTEYPSREAFDTEMDSVLRGYGVEIVCLAGFMRILSEKFVKSWKGALLNVHPALLPSFKGAHAHKDALAMGVRVSGCTVHFVEVEIDSGAIIEQEAVPVLPGDTVETLQERVKVAEHKCFPRALKYLATGRIHLKDDGTLHWNY
ncbi:trifunctional purine biosynthetic protein adenosine-3 [Diachasma alloeum]|uniref:trifunctional purine biosynthetic protein adenosine-3 n=1 Tax=Diachasma alloeum TaxID=454923 RepID=UPI00073838C4|nr:trifunctional purine biosynthetic protein adenosine-3 [Diachasma alloeum]